MLTEQEKERRREKAAYEHWHKIGGIVVDVSGLLQHLSRVGGKDLSPFNAAHLERAKDLAMLVSSHALESIMSTLNNECTSHYVPSDEDFAASK